MTDHDHHLVNRVHNEARLFQEAWLNHLGLSRFVRWVLTIFIAFLACTVFVQGNNREQCEGSRGFALIFYKQQVGVVERQNKVIRAAKDKKSLGYQNAVDARDSAQGIVNLLGPGLKKNCKELYPVVPFIGI